MTENNENLKEYNENRKSLKKALIGLLCAWIGILALYLIRVESTILSIQIKLALLLIFLIFSTMYCIKIMRLAYKVGEIVFYNPPIAHLFFGVIIFFGFYLPGLFLYGIVAYLLVPKENRYRLNTRYINQNELMENN